MNNKKIILTLTLGLCSAAAIVVLSGAGTAKPDAIEDAPIYKDPSQTIENRVKDLMSRMTLEEKVMQLQCVWDKKKELLDEQGEFNASKAEALLKDGIGQIGRPSESHEGVGGKGRTPSNNAAYCNAIQKYLTENTRLGIPAVVHEEFLHGHAALYGTSFSQPIGLASTWDTSLVCNLFEMAAYEGRVRGTHLALTPVVDVARDPRWGRVEETYGEDPFLVSRMGLSAVLGFQGLPSKGIDDKHVMSTLKHFAAHGQPESGTNCAPVNISKRTLRETFLYPFQVCVEQGGVKSIMASYNEIDGVPSHANQWLLEDVLRQEWGFDGIVVSDYFAIEELHRRHKVAADYKQSAAMALKTGVDIELPDPMSYPHLVELVKNGALDEKFVDISCARILSQKFELGLFENPYVDADKADAVVGSEAHRKLALQAARESIVLLQNENNVAPVAKGKTIAVIGPNTDVWLNGGYSDVPRQFVTVIEGIKERAGKDATILHAKGCKITEPGSWYLDPVNASSPKEDAKLVAEAVEIAKKADVIVLAIGGNELTSREAWVESHMGDRTDLQMVGRQDSLVNVLSKLNKPMVAFVFNGRPLAISNVKEKVDAIFECWYLGQETGYAVADVLFGNYNPSGKLPITIPRSVGHIPAYYNHKPTARRGYLFDEVNGLWSFGHGLSYSNFELKNPRLSKQQIAVDGTSSVLVDVTNTSQVDGVEVVQVYLRDDVSSVTRPVKELKGFKRVAVKAGQTATVEIPLTSDALAFWDINMEYTVEPGTFTVMVGNSSDDDDLQSLTLTVQ